MYTSNKKLCTSRIKLTTGCVVSGSFSVEFASEEQQTNINSLSLCCF